MRRTTLLPALMAAACGTDSTLDDPTFPTGSATMIASADYESLYVANVDQGTLVKLSRDGGSLNTLEIGLEPTRLTRVGERVLVTLRGERSVAVLHDGPEGLVLERKLVLGTEPFGIVADEHGRRVYVALSTANEVVELDGADLSERRRWSVPDEPRWLALHPGRKVLYVGSALRGTLTWINVEKNRVHAVTLPRVMGFNAETFAEQPFTPRITGDLSATSDGQLVIVPALYVDNLTPVPTVDELLNGATDRPTGPEGAPPDSDMCFECGGGGGGGYDSNSAGGRFNPSVVAIPVDSVGRPSLADAEVINVSSFGGGEMMTGLNSYPTSVTASPDAGLLAVTMEASGAVVVVARDQGEARLFDMLGSVPSGFQFRTNAAVSAPAGTRGVAFTANNEAFVHGFLDRAVARLPVAEVRDLMSRDDGDMASTMLPAPLRSTDPVEVAPAVLPWVIESGRRLFYAATDSRMASSGAGVSCSTCHFDGRTDGLTWTFTNGLRQTPSLAGQVSLTAPVTWTDAVPTVSEEAMITSQIRMGGFGLSTFESDQIAAFIDFTRDVDVPLKGSEELAVRRGKRVFERADVACATCHSGPMFTDNLPKDIFGLQGVKTRGLIGIAATPPYLHDGSAATLRDVLRRSRGGAMGDTSMLTEPEINDLEAYLKSL